MCVEELYDDTARETHRPNLDALDVAGLRILVWTNGCGLCYSVAVLETVQATIMNINDPWTIHNDETGTRQFPGASIAADDGATYSMDAPRAKRLVALWNAFLGVPTKEIERVAAHKKSISLRKCSKRQSRKG